MSKKKQKNLIHEKCSTPFVVYHLSRTSTTLLLKLKTGQHKQTLPPTMPLLQFLSTAFSRPTWARLATPTSTISTKNMSSTPIVCTSRTSDERSHPHVTSQLHPYHSFSAEHVNCRMADMSGNNTNRISATIDLDISMCLCRDATNSACEVCRSLARWCIVSVQMVSLALSLRDLVRPEPIDTVSATTKHVNCCHQECCAHTLSKTQRSNLFQGTEHLRPHMVASKHDT